MLSEKKLKCAYCSKVSFFYVFTEVKGQKTAIYTQCPKCKQFSDCLYLPKAKVAAALKAVLQGIDPDQDK